MNYFFFCLLTSLLISSLHSYDHPYYKCGKPKPEEETDCTVYGTDSGFLCCFIKDTSGSALCSLLAYSLAEKYGIKGNKTDAATGQYYSCGNSSAYLALSSILFVLIGFIL